MDDVEDYPVGGFREVTGYRRDLAAGGVAGDDVEADHIPDQTALLADPGRANAKNLHCATWIGHRRHF